MLKPDTLLVYPYVKLRMSCPCGYRKAYRLARLAEVFGADFELDDLLFRLMSEQCPKWKHDGTFVRLRCEAKYTDLGSNNPPDVPPAAFRPKLLG